MSRNLTNFLSLSGIQVANAALPLVIFPYLLSVVGTDLYSKVVVTEVISLLVLTIVIYSFDIDGVSQISCLDKKNDIKKISKIFSGIFYIRLFLFLICSVVVLLISTFVDSTYTSLLGWWLLVPLSYVIQSLWLFQGLEYNVPVAIFNILSRTACLVLTLMLVQVPADFMLVPILVGSLFLLSSVLTLSYAFFKLNLRFCSLPVHELVHNLKNGRMIFFGNFSVLLYRDINVLILELLNVGSYFIAIYSMAEKIIKGLQAVVRPLNQLFFPKAIRKIKGISSANVTSWQIILKLTYPQLLIVLIVLIFAILSYQYLEINFPEVLDIPNQSDIALLCLAMMPSILFGIVNFMFGSVGLNYLNERKYLFYCLIGVGVLNIFMCFVLASIFEANGAALAFVTSEVLITILIFNKYLSAKNVKSDTISICSLK